MKKTVLLIGTSLAISLAATSAQACGYCIEDKIASVYDHAVVAEAMAQHHHVAFFGLDGPLGAQDMRVVKTRVESIYGVDTGSVRLSTESAALSLAFNPKRISQAGLQKSMERKLNDKKVLVLPLRVMDAPATLKPVSQ